MEAQNDPQYLRSTQAAVRTFRDEFRTFLQLHVPYVGPMRGLAPAIFPRENVDIAEITRQAEIVAEAAGRARRAASLTGVWIHVEGQELPVDPIAAWSSVSHPKPVLEPENVLIACGQMVGALDEIIAAADAEAPPSVGPSGMHPTIWGAARPLWGDGHYRYAVAAAAEALIGKVKVLTKRHDVPDTSAWQQAFSANPPSEGKPRLRWPGDPENRDVKTMNDGLRMFAPGVQMTIRNPATHGSEDMNEQDAMERLAALSLLARWVDACDRDDGTQDQT